MLKFGRVTSLSQLRLLTFRRLSDAHGGQRRAEVERTNLGKGNLGED